MNPQDQIQEKFQNKAIFPQKCVWKYCLKKAAISAGPACVKTNTKLYQRLSETRRYPISYIS